MLAPPVPDRIRLVSQRPGSSSPRAPFGLAWGDDGARVVELDGGESLAEIAAQIPAAATLEEGALVFVLEEAAKAPGLLGRLRPRSSVSTALRCGALLARGFTRIGAGRDPTTRGDLAWGYV